MWGVGVGCGGPGGEGGGLIPAVEVDHVLVAPSAAWPSRVVNPGRKKARSVAPTRHPPSERGSEAREDATLSSLSLSLSSPLGEPSTGELWSSEERGLWGWGGGGWGGE